MNNTTVGKKTKQVMWKKYNFTTAYKDGVYSKFNYEAYFDALWLVIEIKDTLEDSVSEIQIDYNKFIQGKLSLFPVGFDDVIPFELVDSLILNYVVARIKETNSGEL